MTDLSCPKCLSDDVRLRWCNGDSGWGPRRLCRWGDPDHFHRTCQRCRYEWRTDDVYLPDPHPAQEQQ